LGSLIALDRVKYLYDNQFEWQKLVNKAMAKQCFGLIGAELCELLQRPFLMV
jgi:hypothetical protein